MTTASHPVSHQPSIAVRMAGMLALMTGAIAHSLDKPHHSPFDVLLWTAGLVLGLYACVLGLNALASRPLPSRSLLRLETLAILIILAAAVGAAGTAALSSQWVAAVASASVAALTGAMIWVLARQFRHLRLHS